MPASPPPHVRRRFRARRRSTRTLSHGAVIALERLASSLPSPYDYTQLGYALDTPPPPGARAEASKWASPCQDSHQGLESSDGGRCSSSSSRHIALFSFPRLSPSRRFTLSLFACPVAWPDRATKQSIAGEAGRVSAVFFEKSTGIFVQADTAPGFAFSPGTASDGKGVAGFTAAYSCPCREF